MKCLSVWDHAPAVYFVPFVLHFLREMQALFWISLICNFFNLKKDVWYWLCYSSILTSEFPLSYGTVMNRCCFVLIIKSSFTTVNSGKSQEFRVFVHKYLTVSFLLLVQKLLSFWHFQSYLVLVIGYLWHLKFSPPLHSIHHHHYSQWLIVRHNYHVLESEIVISDKFECISALSRLECKLVRNSFHSSLWFARVSLPLVSGLSSRFSWTSICLYISFWNNSLVLTRYFAASNTFLFLV